MYICPYMKHIVRNKYSCKYKEEASEMNRATESDRCLGRKQSKHFIYHIPKCPDDVKKGKDGCGICYEIDI